MKITYRIPGIQEYSYIELEEDVEGELDNSKVRARFDELQATMQARTGVPADVWNKMVDEYLTKKTITGGGEYYEELNQWQKWFLNEVKKSYKRNQ